MNETKKGNEMKNINEIDLTKGLEVKNFCKKLVSEQGSSITSATYEEDSYSWCVEDTACCYEKLEENVEYNFVIINSEGYYEEVYCGSKCYLLEYNLANRFNEAWTEITKQQFDLISLNC
jgi:hypothetical protein